ncbi:VOC family protein [Streptomyces sp. NPDC052225]|uniref:VOC family protein n=1 Tax=Streptomyces sp. NPDC052225 TaxID=3154949 RepID=UPI00342ADA38
MTGLGTTQVLAAVAEGLGDWRKLAQPLVARYRVGGFAEGAAFVAAIADIAQAAGREPEVRVGGRFVEVSLCTVDEGGGRWITEGDLRLAREVSAAALRLGLDAAPRDVAQLELALDSADFERAGPFWAALLTGSPDHVVHGDVMDPDSRVPNVWFQRTDAHAVPRQRWHLDLWLAPEEAASRIEAAVAAGGTVVDAEHAPSYTVLADPEGNRVCVCTAEGRE